LKRAISFTLTLLVFACSKNIKPTVSMPTFRSFIYPLGINSLHFPDSIKFQFVLASARSCRIEDGKLVESVEERKDSLPYSVRHNHNSFPRKLWILEDCSGSLSGHTAKIDSVALILSSIMKNNEELGFVRFGANVCEVFGSKKEKIKKSRWLSYPDPNGTNLMRAISFLLAKNEGNFPSKSVLLFSDGDLPYDFPTDSFLSVLKEANLRLFTVGIGNCREGMLEHLATHSDGFFLQGNPLSAEQIALLLYTGTTQYFTISYSPRENNPDGKEHIVHFALPCRQSLTFRYRAPLIQTPAQQEGLAHIKLPEEPFIIPFLELNNAEITPLGLLIMDSICAIIKSIPTSQKVVLQIDGYTCSIGDDDYNLMLSRKRARAVELLLRKAFEKSTNVESVVGWHGKLNPRYPNDTEAGRELNRRVEVRIFIKGDSN